MSVAFALPLTSVIVSAMVSSVSSVLASVLFLVVKVLNSSWADTRGPGVSSVSEGWGGEVVIAVEKGVGDSFKTQTLSALRV